MADNVFCIDCKRPFDDHAPDCECAMATDLIGMMAPTIGAMWKSMDDFWQTRTGRTGADGRLLPVGMFDPFLPGRHDVGYPKPCRYCGSDLAFCPLDPVSTGNFNCAGEYVCGPTPPCRSAPKHEGD